jgi:isocitrate dehydrogenase (NAD+)
VTHRVTLIPGDGIGPEVVEAARRVLDATGVSFEWDRQDAGFEVWEREGDPLPTRVLESIGETRLALKGPTKTPLGDFRPINMPLREEFDLYANIRPSRAYEGVPTRFPETDLVVVRMAREDMYAGIEYPVGEDATARLRALIRETHGTELPPDSGITIKSLSASESKRVARKAFEYLKENGRRKLTIVHKANVIKHSDGLFLESAREVAETEYADVECDDRRVDSLCAELVMRPADFDVLVMPLAYGDIVSDLTAGLSGGLGMAPGVNLGDEHAIFEAVHGTAPRHAGKNRANPIALILCGAMLLRHVGEAQAAERVERAVADVVRDGKRVTYDLKPSRDDPSAAGTSEVADAVVETMSRAPIINTGPRP